ncbi:MAG TPA: PAS domain S-box protein, partial [Verrucomicrobiae bacterium]|nr:PAS domain S-box protein [Verrucomicrobiae bacterium]
MPRLTSASGISPKTVPIGHSPPAPETTPSNASASLSIAVNLSLKTKSSFHRKEVARYIPRHCPAPPKTVILPISANYLVLDAWALRLLIRFNGFCVINNENYFASIFESSDDAIITKDLNGVILSWNPGAEKIFGYTSAEIVGKPVAILIPEDHEDEEPKILAQIRSGKKIDHYETVRKRKNGALVNISLTVSPIKDAGGKIVGASKIARDITAQKQAENSVQAAREELA